MPDYGGNAKEPTGEGGVAPPYSGMPSPAPEKLAAPPPPKVLADNFVIEPDRLLFRCGGRGLSIPRGVPIAVAYERLTANVWSHLQDDACQQGKPTLAELERVQAATATAPERTGIFSRIFGAKPKADQAAQPSPQDEWLERYKHELRISPDLAVSNIAISETGEPLLGMNDGSRVKLAPAHEMSRDVVLLLEALEVVGLEASQEIANLNLALQRPTYSRIRHLGRKLAPALDATEAKPVAPVEDAGAPLVDAPLAGESAPIPGAHDDDHGEHSSMPVEEEQSIGAVHEEPPPAPSEDHGAPMETIAPVPEIPVRPAVEAPVVQVAAPVERPDSTPPGVPEAAEDESRASATAEESAPPPAAAAQPVEPARPPRPKIEVPAVPPDEDFAAPVQEQRPRMAIRERGPHWSDGHVRLSPQQRPQPNQPVLMCAMGEEAKAHALGLVQIERQDYEVIKWLQRTGRDARYKIELDPASVDDPQPKARVSRARVRNESKVLVSVDWDKCVDDFKQADQKVQTTQAAELSKSATIQTQVSTALLPGTAPLPKPPKPEEIARPLSLPVLRPVVVPKMASPGRGGFSR